MTLPDRVTDKLWDAIETAVRLGVDPIDFRRESLLAWCDALDQAKRHARQAFTKEAVR